MEEEADLRIKYDTLSCNELAYKVTDIDSKLERENRSKRISILSSMFASNKEEEELDDLSATLSQTIINDLRNDKDLIRQSQLRKKCVISAGQST